MAVDEGMRESLTMHVDEVAIDLHHQRNAVLTQVQFMIHRSLVVKRHWQGMSSVMQCVAIAGA